MQRSRRYCVHTPTCCLQSNRTCV